MSGKLNRPAHTAPCAKPLCDSSRLNRLAKISSASLRGNGASYSLLRTVVVEVCWSVPLPLGSNMGASQVRGPKPSTMGMDIITPLAGAIEKHCTTALTRTPQSCRASIFRPKLEPYAPFGCTI